MLLIQTLLLVLQYNNNTKNNKDMKATVETSVRYQREVEFIINDNPYLSGLLAQQYSNTWESEDLDEDELDELLCTLEELFSEFEDEVEVRTV